MNSSLLKVSEIILKFSSAAFVVAAFYHLLALFFVLNNSPEWRNILFVFINLWCALEIGRVKKYFIILFTVLFIQQLAGHGNSILKNMNVKIDWLSILVLTAITIIYIALLVSAINKFKIKSSYP